MSTYWCCLYTRDGEETLERTLASIIGQKSPPFHIIVVNDGSTDGTAGILHSASKTFKAFYVINTNSKTRDIRRAPWLLNLALEAAQRLAETEYMMISGDDCEYPPGYASKIIGRMTARPAIAVASGDWGMPATPGVVKTPHGAGRFVRTRFMKSIGGKYPIAYGWESWLPFKALQQGWEISKFEDIRYRHLRPYQPGNVYGWGRGMYSLGYPFYFVLLRFFKNLLFRTKGMMSISASVSMLAGYLASLFNPGRVKGMVIQDLSLKGFVRWTCIFRIASFLAPQTKVDAK